MAEANGQVVDLYDDIDDETLALVLQLELENIDELESMLGEQGRNPAGRERDDQATFRAQRREYEHAVRNLLDRHDAINVEARERRQDRDGPRYHFDPQRAVQTQAIPQRITAQLIAPVAFGVDFVVDRTLSPATTVHNTAAQNNTTSTKDSQGGARLNTLPSTQSGTSKFTGPQGITSFHTNFISAGTQGVPSVAKEVQKNPGQTSQSSPGPDITSKSIKSNKSGAVTAARITVEKPTDSETSYRSGIIFQSVSATTNPSSEVLEPQGIKYGSLPIQPLVTQLIRTPSIADSIAKDATVKWDGGKNGKDAVGKLGSEGDTVKEANENDFPVDFNKSEITTTSSSAISQGKKKATFVCEICLDPLADQEAVAMPCEAAHYWCKTCIQTVFERSCELETQYPPRCCSILSTKDFETHLSPEFIAKYQLKVEEYSAPTPRKYCSNAKCREFLRAVDIKDGKGVCKKCKAATCATCVEAWHPGRDCPNDPEIDALLMLAELNGWPQCRKCRGILSKMDGCNELQCHFCHTMSCYACGKPYVNRICRCHCPNAFFTEVDAKNEITDLHAWKASGASCKHDKGWMSVSERGNCHVCNFYMPKFCYRCRVCKLQSCRRCTGGI